jgi:hypothetical protein
LRYRLKTKVEGDLVPTGNVATEHDGISYELATDREGRATEVVVSVQVSAEEFATYCGPGEGGTARTIRISGDPAVHKRLIAALQALESHLGFSCNGNLQRIRWDVVTIERVAENADEQALAAVQSYARERAYPRGSVRLKPETFRAIVAKSATYQELVLPKAFWLEGMNEFKQLRYIQAFYNFFFVLEDFYAEGKSAMSAVLKAFAGSTEFCHVVDWSLQRVFGYSEHRANLERFFAEERCQRDTQGAQRLLLKVRGNLHHYSSRGARRRGTPRNQDDFQSIALLTMTMASYAIGLREAAISQRAMASQPESHSRPEAHHA